MSPFLSVALRPAVVRRGWAYAAVVGAIRVGIHHGDGVLAGEMTWGRWFKAGVAVLVPYGGLTRSSVVALRAERHDG